MNIPIKKSRRFYKDRRHAYGWEVVFKMSVKFPDGHVERRIFFDIGTDKTAAINNAMKTVQYCFPRTSIQDKTSI
jgi:hypothetical protein